jgi:hypothetical protein
MTQPPASRLGQQIAEVAAALSAIGARHALIGGLALASHKVVHATQDVDLLVDADRADEVDATMHGLGYRCLHRSADAANYVRGDERVDFLYAVRPIARRLLDAAPRLRTSLGELRVVSPEGLIGFKLQGWVNDRQRTQDLEDIRALLRANMGASTSWKCASTFDSSIAKRCSMTSSAKSAEPPFAADGGLALPPREAADPYQALDELMVVVEALCPVWPHRATFPADSRMLL